MSRSMKKILSLALPVTALVVGFAEDASAKKIVSNYASVTDGSTIVAGRRYATGSYIYVGPSATGGINGYIYVQAGSYLDGDSAQNQDSTVITENRTVLAATEAQIHMISNRIGKANGELIGGNSAIAAGGNSGSGFRPQNVWFDAAYNRLEDSSRSSKWDANLYSMALGADYKISERFMAGLAVTFSFLKGKTQYNSGNIDDSAIGVAPYASLRVSDFLFFDAVAGYSYATKKRDRLTPSSTATAPVTANLTGPRVSSKPKADRYFGSLAANLTHRINRVGLLGRLGIVHAVDAQRAFRESDGGAYTKQTSRATVLGLLLKASYKVSDKFEPFVFATYDHKLSISKADVPDAKAVISSRDTAAAYYSPNKEQSNGLFGGGLGASFAINQSWSGDIEGHYKASKRFKDYGGKIGVKCKL